jgi:hypothetical protein
MRDPEQEITQNILGFWIDDHSNCDITNKLHIHEICMLLIVQQSWCQEVVYIHMIRGQRETVKQLPVIHYVWLGNERRKTWQEVKTINCHFSCGMEVFLDDSRLMSETI